MRKGEVETIEYNRDKGLTVTVYMGKRRGHASSVDTSPAALEAAVDKALTIARYTEEDDCAGLADPERLARVRASAEFGRLIVRGGFAVDHVGVVSARLDSEAARFVGESNGLTTDLT